MWVHGRLLSGIHSAVYHFSTFLPVANGSFHDTQTIIDQDFLNAHFAISFHVGFLPYNKIPVR